MLSISIVRHARSARCSATSTARAGAGSRGTGSRYDAVRTGHATSSTWRRGADDTSRCCRCPETWLFITLTLNKGFFQKKIETGLTENSKWVFDRVFTKMLEMG